MHTLARPPVRESFLKRQAGIRAFTLIELLTVIGIIAILAAITFGVVKGVNERAAINQAKTELASISQALEAYKQQYGDYPQVGAGTWTGLTTNETKLFQALAGFRGPQGAPISGKSFIEASKYTLYITDPTKDAFDPANVNGLKFLDPWGRDYYYLYKSTGWTSPTYVLLSTGPDGYSYDTTLAPSTSNLLNADGTVKATASDNKGAADNIYANR